MDKITILDFGGQYVHLIANRIRRLGVYAEIIEPDQKISTEGLKGIILSGGPSSVYAKDAPKYDDKIFSLGVPILGICYGQQLISYALGGKVEPCKAKEYGVAKLRIDNEIEILKGLSKEEQVWMSHGDSVTELPCGFIDAASTHDCAVAAIADEKRKIYGVQFHPEVTHTPNGARIFQNFIEICCCRKEWSMSQYIKSIEQEIKEQAGDKKVFMLVSGGVDSTVAFSLLEKALGDKAYGLHIDSGLMRYDESRTVVNELAKLGWKLHLIDASDDFMKALEGLTDPEEKRKAIGKTFIEITDRHIKQVVGKDGWMIGQGTIYPDTIESGRTKNADVIKTHHNRAGIVQELISQGKIIEPLQQLYKDEVRELGLELGLPRELVMRHPFPGPGLAIRILCSEGPDVLSGSENIEEQIRGMFPGYDAKVLPIKSVGVQGDARSYKHPVLISGKLDWDILEEISSKITNNFRDINRVVFCPRKIAEISVITAAITNARLLLARLADNVVMTGLIQHDLMDSIWQCPTVLLPVTIDGKECVVLRPINSSEAMTANFARMPAKAIEDISSRLMKLQIGEVFYDITNKPPGTIEWE
jgi:GMP synthase (glutamine-hydrolysing)